MSKKLNPLAPYEWAQKELKSSILEFPGPQNNNPRIVWYHAFTSLRASNDEVPWCSSFMCAAAESTGFKSTRSAAAKSWLTYGEEGTGEPGDIAVFSRGGGNHVAFIHSKYTKGDKNVLVLGGNQSNAVRSSKYPADRLLAIRRFKA